ncbi:MAG: GspE/PulE family protein [Patescibacteria group bacterium]
MQIDPLKFKEFVIDSGLISRADVEAAEVLSKKERTGLGDQLVLSGKISEADVRRMEAYLLGIPFVELKDQKIDFEVLSLIPEPIARKHNVVAFRRTPKSVEVAMLDPQDLESIDFIKKKLSLRIEPRLTDRDSIKSALLSYQKSLKAEFGDLIQKESSGIKSVAEGDDVVVEEKDLEALAKDVPVVRIVDTLINHAILQRASDIHIEPGQNELVIRYRIDGILHDAMVLPKNTSSGIVARIKVLSNLRLDEKRLPQDGRFRVEEGGDVPARVSFRVSTLPTFYGEKVVLRLLRENAKGFSLEVLGFHGESLEKIHEASHATTGIMLTTGPTGSGKSTTLYTLLDLLNTPDVNISTVEDPIEYQMPRVNQTQVKPEIGLTFANGLRALLRQDPNIIMVGEIRDGETAALAVNAALTGHLVLSTLHTNSAAGAIPRLIEMGSEPFLIVSTVNLIIAQRLVRRLGPGAKKALLTKTELENLARHADLDRVLKALHAEKKVRADDTWSTIPFWKPEPSTDAPDGYLGRLTIGEVFKMSSAIKELIMKSGTADTIHEQARKEGMLTMFEDGVFQAASGVTSLEEVFRVVGE